MITNDQLDVLRELLGDAWAGRADITSDQWDALAAAIATIEGLPVDKNGVHVAPGAFVYHGDSFAIMPGCRGNAGVTLNDGRVVRIGDCVANGSCPSAPSAAAKGVAGE